MSVRVHDSTRCLLGEGAFWHPEREQFFWCDILSRRVLSREGGALRDWTFDGFVSALGWIDRDRLLVGTDRGLTMLNLETDARETLCDVEADEAGTRPNDGRADPFGGFWISTMSIAKETGRGSLYRWYRGELRKLKGGMSVANAICFTPDGRHAYFTDTPTQLVMRWALGQDGWPEGKPEVWLDLRDTGHLPDGAICDADGNLWSAGWGSGHVACYGPDARFRFAVKVEATQTTCPALGGPDLGTLYITTAAIGLSEEEIARVDAHGRTFEADVDARGQREHRVIV